MGSKVFPLPGWVLLFLMSQVSSLHDGRNARRLDFGSRRSFFPPSSDLAHLPLSGFSHQVNNHVVTPFSVPGLEDLPPIIKRRTQPENIPRKSETDKIPTVSNTRPSPPKPKFPQPPPIIKPSNTGPTVTPNLFPSRKTYQTNFHPPGAFPAIFDPFKNFFNFKSFPKARINPASTSEATPSTEIRTIATFFTTPHTTPRPVLGASATSVASATQKPFKDDPRLINKESVYEYDTDTNEGYDDIVNYVNDDDVNSDYQSSFDYDYEDDKYSNSNNAVEDDYPQYETNPSPSCPGSLRECLTACSPVITINQLAYKLCVNECLDRCA